MRSFHRIHTKYLEYVHNPIQSVYFFYFNDHNHSFIFHIPNVRAFFCATCSAIWLVIKQFARLESFIWQYMYMILHVENDTLKCISDLCRHWWFDRGGRRERCHRENNAAFRTAWHFGDLNWKLLFICPISNEIMITLGLWPIQWNKR